MKKDKKLKFYWEENEKPKYSGMKIGVPGYNKDEIIVTIKNNMLSISAMKKKNRTEKGKNFFMQESFTSSFNRSMPLPGEFSPKNFEIVAEDGGVNIRKKKKRVEESAR